MSDLKARLRTVQRGLEEALGKASGYQDPNLSPEGLQAKRTELAKAARAAAGPQLAALRAEVATAAQEAAGKASAALPKAGTDATGISVKWAQVAMRLDAGMSLHDIVSRADVDTLHAIAEYAPSWVEAQSFKAGAGRGSRPQSTPDHTALRRSVDERLAQLTGKGAVSALADARSAAGEAAYLEVAGRRLDSLIDGRAPSSTMLAAAIEPEHAEQLAVNGIPEQSPTGDTQDGGA